MRHDKRVVLVTGGSGGIGEALVERYARDGAAVGIVDVNEETGAALARRLADAGLRVHFAHADVGDFTECEAACRSIEAALGPIDTLVNNAGIFIAKPFTQYTETDFASTTATVMLQP